MSRQLRNILKQIRTLEEKMYRHSGKVDISKELIDSQELSAALSRQAKTIIENRSDNLDICKLINELDITRGRSLPTYEKNALQIIEIIFNYLRTNTNCDPRYYLLLNRLQLAFTRLSLNDLSFLDNPKHVAVKLLNNLLTLGSHFDASAGKLAHYFIHAIEQLIERLADRERVDNKLFIMADKKLTEYFDSFNDKTNTNINLILSEIDRDSRQEQANQFTEQLIKSKTQGEEMPIFLLDFFNNLVAPLLHKTIAEYGVKSKNCQQLLTDMDTLSWSIISAHGDSNYAQRYQADVADSMRRLYQMFDTYNANDSYVKDFFIEAEDIHNRKLRGERVQYDLMIAADIFADEDYESDEPVYWFDELDKAQFDINSLEEGNWFFLTHNKKKLRSQLLLINQLTNELVFVNLSGELVAKVNFSDTAFLCNHLHAIQQDNAIEYQHALKAVMRELKSRLELLKHKYQLILEQRAKERQEKHQREQIEQATLRRQREEELKLEVLRKQAELKRKAEREAEEKRLAELDAKERFHLKSIYKKLTPGVVIAYKNDTQRWVEASLMLISKTTERHIFTDSHGKTVLEPTKDELFSLIGKQRVKVIKQPESPNDPLSSLVRERRLKLSRM